MLPIRIEYHGGPYDGAHEVLDLNKLGLRVMEGFELPHLTANQMHFYRCELWTGKLDIDVRHDRSIMRPDKVGA